MSKDDLRRRICFTAAQLLYSRRETDFKAAQWRAARSITRSYIPSEALPTFLEVRHVLQQLVSRQLPTVDQFVPDQPMSDDDLPENRLDLYHELLEPLDRVRLPVDTHPEGDLLYHSLQVFEVAFEKRPWDEEFLVAALLHEVGRGIDPVNSHGATLNAVQRIVSERSLWFIENLPTQHRLYDGTIGVRARRRLSAHEDGEELKLLAHCDSEGRVPGRRVRDLPDVLDEIRTLAWL